MRMFSEVCFVVVRTLSCYTMSVLNHKLAAMINAAGTSGNIVRATRDILNLLKAEGVAVEMRLQPNLVGIHPANRDGLGVSLSDSEALISNIFDLGWSDSEINGICVETNAEMRAYNQNLMANVGLPSFSNVDCVKYASLSASHTNQGLRLIMAGATHSDPRMTVDGHLSLEKISARDPLMGEAARLGFQWLVIPIHIMDAHPGLPSLIQSAMNSSNQISRSESELQVLRRLHNFWLEEATKVGPGGRVDFGEIRRKTVVSKPPCSAWLTAMFQFVLKASGGKEATFLSSTEMFLKSQPCQVKMLGKDVYESLSMDIKGSVDQFVRLRHAILKAGYCVGVAAPDIKRLLAKDKDNALANAEALLLEMDGVTSSSSQAMQHLSHDVMVMQGLFEVDVALKLLGKRAGSLEYLAHLFLSGLQAATGATFTNRFTALAAKEIEDAQKRAAASSDQKSYDSQRLVSS